MEPKNKKTKHTGECWSHTNTNFSTDIRFAGNLNTEQLIRQWIDSDENIAKLGWYYASSVIAAVFRPDNVNFVVAQMSRLYQSIQMVKRKQVHQRSITYLLKESVLIVRRHSSRYVKNHFHERSGKVRGRFTGGTIPLQTTKKASVRFQFNLIKKWFYLGMERICILFNNSPPMLVRRQSLQTLDYTTGIGENGIFNFLTCSHIDDGNFVRLSTFL